mmetsp:Transcript_41642/g.84927  ORF Transcript_41642/g.84927 Transcript_41642/m.84927 type:complete len:222 (-) Transcript_41642:3-668(-)
MKPACWNRGMCAIPHQISGTCHDGSLGLRQRQSCCCLMDFEPLSRKAVLLTLVLITVCRQNMYVCTARIQGERELGRHGAKPRLRAAMRLPPTAHHGVHAPASHAPLLLATQGDSSTAAVLWNLIPPCSDKHAVVAKVDMGLVALEPLHQGLRLPPACHACGVFALNDPCKENPRQHDQQEGRRQPKQVHDSWFRSFTTTQGHGPRERHRTIERQNMCIPR